MTLNGEMALILRYFFTEFGNFRGVLRKSGWQSHNYGQFTITMIRRIVTLLKHGQDPNWISIYCHLLSSLSFSLLLLLISLLKFSCKSKKILFVRSRRPSAPGALRQLPHRASRSYATGGVTWQVGDAAFSKLLQSLVLYFPVYLAVRKYSYISGQYRWAIVWACTTIIFNFFVTVWRIFCKQRCVFACLLTNKKLG